MAGIMAEHGKAALKYIVQVAMDKHGTQEVNKEMAHMNKVIHAASTGNQKDLNSLGASYHDVAKSITKDGVTTTKAFRMVNGNLTKYSGKMDQYGFQMAKVNEHFAPMAKGATYTSNAMAKLGKSQTSVIASSAKLAMRAVATIPIWMALRAVYSGAAKIVKSLISTYRELEEGMKKVMAVATYTNDTQAKTYATLEAKARGYYATTTKGMKDITEAMYQLGTAGRSTEEMLGGFTHILDLAIGTFGDVKQAGQLVSGILNVFDKQLQDLGSTTNQVKYITDLLADAWKNNQIELSEMQTSMSYLGSVGGALDIKLQHLIASASVMSDAMLRGGKGGRLLSTAFAKIAKDSDKLRALGVIFDPYKPLDYMDVMTQIHDIYLEQGNTLGMLNDLIDVFGIRGGRAVLNVMQQWEKLNKELGRTPEQIDGTAAELKKLAESSTWDLIAKRWHQAISSPSEGSGEPGWIKKLAIWKVTEGQDNDKWVTDFQKSFKILRDEIGLTKDELSELQHFMLLLGEYNTAKMISKEISWKDRITGAGASWSKLDAGKDKADEIIKVLRLLEDADLLDLFEKPNEDIMKMKNNLIDFNNIGEIIGGVLDGIEKSWHEQGKTIDDLTQKEIDLWKNIVQNYTGVIKSEEEIKKAIEARLSVMKKEFDDTGRMGVAGAKMVENAENELKLLKLKNDGLRESKLIEQEILMDVEQHNDDIDRAIKKTSDKLVKEELFLTTLKKESEEYKSHEETIETLRKTLKNLSSMGTIKLDIFGDTILENVTKLVEGGFKDKGLENIVDKLSEALTVKFEEGEISKADEDKMTMAHKLKMAKLDERILTSDILAEELKLLEANKELLETNEGLKKQKQLIYDIELAKAKELKEQVKWAKKLEEIENKKISTHLKNEEKELLELEKEKQSVLGVVVDYAMDLASAYDLSESSSLKLLSEIEQMLGIEKTALELAERKLDIKSAETKELKKQKDLSSESIQLYKIAIAYGPKVADSIADVLSGTKNIEDQSKLVKNLIVKFFGDALDALQAGNYFDNKVKNISISEKQNDRGEIKKIKDDVKSKIDPDTPLGILLQSIETGMEGKELNVANLIINAASLTNLADSMKLAFESALNNPDYVEMMDSNRESLYGASLEKTSEKTGTSEYLPISLMKMNQELLEKYRPEINAKSKIQDEKDIKFMNTIKNQILVNITGNIGEMSEEETKEFIVDALRNDESSISINVDRRIEKN